ncbi:hypothetical protein N7492_000042 [Penicillium capsulatum]|uniref:BYS1 domain protein n=1 Tax=Penicillium capsulatum TaxID=69766 RepID=A0A9W9LY67_9EURO|nr:hypothetical protein N7492_000042 [Penicillium capsulatum]KAJ6130886.1 hypothetical protein N7512_003666 [Penicillium capsulatum]
MHLAAVVASVAALAPLASAAGHAIIKNNCDHTVYAWSVGSSVGPAQTIESGKSYTEQLRHDPVSGGISLKITKEADGLYTGKPQTNFAYTLDSERVWYDLSDVFGDPFSGKSLLVKPSVVSCPNICWAEGVSPGGSQTKDCESSADITLNLCADKC